MDQDGMAKAFGFKIMNIPEFEGDGPRVIEHQELIRLYESELSVPKEHKIEERLFISLGSEQIEIDPDPKYTLRNKTDPRVYRQLIAVDPSWKEQFEVELVYGWTNEFTHARKILTSNIKDK